MRIESVTLSAYSAKLDAPITNGLYTYATTDISVVEIRTQDGTVGTGWAHGGPILTASLEQIAPLVVGEELAPERIWAKIYQPKLFGRKGLETRAQSAIDIAVWDALGRITGRPLYQMVGGFRNKVPAYMAGGYYGVGKTLEDLQAEIRARVSSGARAVKMKIGAVPVAEDIERIDAVLDAAGPGVSVLVDANNAYGRIEALQMARALEKRQIYWFEEPLDPDDIEGTAELVRRTDVPIAVGENEYTLAGFRGLIDARSATVLNADAQVLGGITQWVKCAHYAEAHGIPVAPHGDQEVHVHLVCGVPNGRIVEYYDNSLNALKEALFKERLEIAPDGDILAPERPGHGFTINHAAAEQFRVR
jgi:L-alanine-DL-glutamate epimerase-like enolase superfamily enzyme